MDISNTSYTNKDFQKLFPEMLDLVKNLTNKWDPSLSNESDPGVVLLKINAILGDKLNYNIDKNVLECFPASVTQERNARQMYEQLGYRMPWQQSATTNISIRYAGSNLNHNYVNLPAFTMVTDDDNSIVYTLVGPDNATSENGFCVGDQRLTLDGSIVTFKAIQGTAVRYDINGETTIKASMLDSNNRLYFNSTDIAENGIFITNVEGGEIKNNYSDWQRKDSLLVYNLNNTYYKFGVSQDTSTCYLEFPEDAENVIREGVQITYIRGNGNAGNIPALTISKFIADLVLPDNQGNNTSLNAESCRIVNYSSSTDGKDSQSIEDAYDSYQRIVGTFDTLVSLRDYINYIVTNKLASNGFATDRTCDPQSVYLVSSIEDGVVQESPCVDEALSANSILGYDEHGAAAGSFYTKDKVLTAFSLKLYLLQYTTDTGTAQGYNKTFTLATPSQLENVQTFIADQKSISHDYAPFRTPSSTRSNICFFINRYPVNCRIITKYSLAQAQADEVAANVRKALFNNLNSQKVSFSENITVEKLTDIIVNADSRIKAVSVDNIDYTTYAVYWDGTKFSEQQINNLVEDDVTFTCDYDLSFEYDSTRTYTSTGTVSQQYCLYNGERYKVKEGTFGPEPFNKYHWDLAKVSPVVDYEALSQALGYGLYPSILCVYDEDDGWSYTVVDAEAQLAGITLSTEDSYAVNSIVIRPSLYRQFVDEIYAKSILANRTRLYIQDEVVDYRLSQSKNWSIAGVNTITDQVAKLNTNSTITFTNSNNEKKLRDNESIQLFCPNLIQGTTYSNYVKFEYTVNKVIQPNEDYELKNNEYFCAYWKNEGDSGEFYSYHIYGPGNIICPSFQLAVNTELPCCFSELIGEDYAYLRNIGTEDYPIYVRDNTNDGSMSSALNDQIATLVNQKNILSGSKKVSIKKINKLDIDSTYSCYWITNTKDEYGRYILSFDDDEERILAAGEYFIYSNSNLTDLTILGTGAKIKRNNWDTSIYPDDMIVDNFDTEQIIENGVQFLSKQNAWYKLPTTASFTLIEQKYITIQPGATLKLTHPNTWSAVFSRDGYETTYPLSEFQIQYKNSDDEDYITIDALSISSISGWDARSQMSLSISRDVNQIIYDGQSIDIYRDGTADILTINGAAMDDENRCYPICVMCSSSIDLDGSGIQDVSMMDETGNITFPIIYLSSLKLNSLDNTVKYTSTGNTVFTWAQEDTDDKEIEFSVPAGEYIVKYQNSAISTVASPELYIYVDGAKIGSMYDGSTSLGYTKETFLYMSLEDIEGNHTLKIEVPDHSSDIIINLENIFKFVKPESMSDAYFARMRAMVKQLDLNQKFNYTADISDDKIIADPLNAKNFLNQNHVFYNNTICAMDTTANSTIYIMDKK